MMKKLLTLIVFNGVLVATAFAQHEDDALKCLELTFFHPKVFKKIFFEYEANYKYGGISPSGKCAFILPDTIFTSVVPNIMERLDWSVPKEKMIATSALIAKEKGSVYTSANWADVCIESWVRFDHFDVSDKEVRMVFHTTDYVGKTATKELKFYKVKSTLQRYGTDWKVKQIHIEETGCCDDKREFLNSVRRRF